MTAPADPWRPKRFWTAAGVVAGEAGWAVQLDGRPVRTPAKAAFAVPSRALALAVAAEWDAQTGQVAPETMPLTRTANTAIDKLMRDHAIVAADLAGYGDSDLLCYRAEAPLELALRQAAAWDPWLDWAATSLGAPLATTRGVMPRPQPPESLSRLAARVQALDPFRLAAFHDLVALSGSLVLGLAVLDGDLPAGAAWHVSRIDEDWQREQWGEDDEATRHAARRERAFADAARFLDLIRAG